MAMGELSLLPAVRKAGARHHHRRRRLLLPASDPRRHRPRALTMSPAFCARPCRRPADAARRRVAAVEAWDASSTGVQPIVWTVDAAARRQVRFNQPPSRPTHSMLRPRQHDALDRRSIGREDDMPCRETAAAARGLVEIAARPGRRTVPSRACGAGLCRRLQSARSARCRASAPGSCPGSWRSWSARFGVLLIVQALLFEGDRLERWHLRGPVFVLGAVLVFAMVIRGSTLNFGGFAGIPAAGIDQGPGARADRGRAARGDGLVVRRQGHAALEIVVFAVVMTLVVRPPVQGAAQPADPVRPGRPDPRAAQRTPMWASSRRSRQASSPSRT